VLATEQDGTSAWEGAGWLGDSTAETIEGGAEGGAAEALGGGGEGDVSPDGVTGAEGFEATEGGEGGIVVTPGKEEEEEEEEENVWRCQRTTTELDMAGDTATWVFDSKRFYLTESCPAAATFSEDVMKKGHSVGAGR
jgi:hypothetical protein